MGRWACGLVLGLLGCGGGAPTGDSGPGGRVLEGPFVGLRVDVSPDLTGDGLPDVLLGVPGLTGDGAVHVYSGPFSGTLRPNDATATVQAGRDHALGEGLAACGDVDGDGVNDLLLGAPDLNGRGGAWFLSGPLAGTRSTEEARAIPGLEQGARLGFTVACDGDTDGDGLADLAVGAPNADGFGVATVAGQVFFYAGSEGGPKAIGSLGTTFSGSQLGAERSVVLRDLDGDDLADAIVGAPGVGRVHVLYGPLAGTYDPNVSGLTLQTDDDRDGAGSALAVGDVTGDGVPDLIVGAPSFDLRRGRVAVIPGPVPLDGSHRMADRGFWLEGVERRGQAGWAVAVGDVDGDGVDDLVVGAPTVEGAGPEAGAVYVLRGPVDEGARLDEAELIVRGDTAWAGLGWSVAVMPGVGVLVGGPFTDVDGLTGAGAAWLFEGSLTGERAPSDAVATFLP